MKSNSPNIHTSNQQQKRRVSFGAASGAAADDETPQDPAYLAEVSGSATLSPTTSSPFSDVETSGLTMDSGFPKNNSGEGQATSASTFMGNIKPRDVGNIFRASSTTAKISQEQIVRIKIMHDKISDGVDFNFNYYCLLMVASCIAALGLATDSATTVISSMLLSPIMGPVIGMSYGLVIWDVPLIKKSARNEICSIVICIVFGFVIGLCTCWTRMADDWPTNEMLSRGTMTTFLAGIPIAFLSGLGVALSVLDDATSSLVGVAISASLLPPAVNSGLLWIVTIADATGALSFINVSGYDFFKMGWISLSLTVVNVVVVWIGAATMFRVKEVLPIKKSVFWKDLTEARRVYQKRAIDENGNIVSAEKYIPERPKDDPFHFAEKEVKGFLHKKVRSRDDEDMNKLVEPHDIDLEAGRDPGALN